MLLVSLGLLAPQRPIYRMTSGFFRCTLGLAPTRNASGTAVFVSFSFYHYRLFPEPYSHISQESHSGFEGQKGLFAQVCSRENHF